MKKVVKQVRCKYCGRPVCSYVTTEEDNSKYEVVCLMCLSKNNKAYV